MLVKMMTMGLMLMEIVMTRTYMRYVVMCVYIYEVYMHEVCACVYIYEVCMHVCSTQVEVVSLALTSSVLPC